MNLAPEVPCVTFTSEMSGRRQDVSSNLLLFSICELDAATADMSILFIMAKNLRLKK
jgi:hypothetical protein